MKIRMHTVISVLFLLFFIAGISALASPGDAAVLVTQGDTLVTDNDYAEAIEAYEQAISIDKNNFNAWNGKADALNRLQKFPEALAASDTALALEPANTKGWINRGYILYNLGRYEDELKTYETAITLEPDNALAWFNKGYSFAGLKRYDEAIAAFDKVAVLQPDYPNLAANRKIAVQLRDADTPAYVRYAPVVGAVALFLLLTGGYFLYRHKTRTISDTIEKDNRQSRRRKEKLS